MAAGTKFYVYANGRWREVEAANGRVAGWSGRARFVYARRGRLHLARTRRVLAALRALAAGQPAAVCDGPHLSQRSCVKVQQSKKSSQLMIAENEHHHCCHHSHIERCNNSTTSNIIVKPRETLKINTGTQYAGKVDASTQAFAPTTSSRKLIIEPKLRIASRPINAHNIATVKKPSPICSVGLKARPQLLSGSNKSRKTLNEHNHDSSSDNYYETTKGTLDKNAGRNVKSKSRSPINNISSPAKRKCSKTRSSDDDVVEINSKQTSTKNRGVDQHSKLEPHSIFKTKFFTKHRQPKSKSSNDSSANLTCEKQSKGTGSNDIVSHLHKNASNKIKTIDQELRKTLKSKLAYNPSKKHRSKSISSVEKSPTRKTRRSKGLSSHKNSSQINITDQDFKSKLRSQLKANRTRSNSIFAPDSQPEFESQRRLNSTSSDESEVLSMKISKQYNIYENLKSNVHTPLKQKLSPTKRKRSSTSDESPVNSAPNRDLTAKKRADFSSQDENCKELSIEETDIEILRSFLNKTSAKFDLKRFDDDDEYKRKYFYKINPLVNLERSSEILRLTNESNKYRLELKDFASKLGLRSVSEDTDKENRKKTDTKKQESKQKSNETSGNTKVSCDKIYRNESKVTHRKLMASNNANKEKNNNQTVPITSGDRNSLPVKNQSSASTKPASDDPKLPPIQSKHSISKRPSSWKAKEYSNLEDHTIVAWVSVGGRARSVNGNKIWLELQDQYSQLTGQHRTWQSLRNRYLRYILPSLATLSLPPTHVSRLRAAAASGKLKSRKHPARRNSIFDTSGVRGASARVRRAPHSLPADSRDSSKRTARTNSPGSSPSPKRLLRPRERSPSSSSSPPSPRERRQPPRGRRESPRYSAVTREFVARHESRSTPRSSSAACRPPDLPARPANAPRTRKLYNPKAVL